MPATLPLPANSTKHLPLLQHPLPRDAGIVLPLGQISSEGGTSVSHHPPTPNLPDTRLVLLTLQTGTTGTTLWLGAQVLATYLADTLSTSSTSSGAQAARKRCLDLGSGVGYLPVCLAAWGWDVVATDIEPVVSTVLRPNAEAGLEAIKREIARRGKSLAEVGSVEVRELDWFAFVNDNSEIFLPTSQSQFSSPPRDPIDGGYVDLILTTDTLYTPSLTIPLWSALTSLANLSRTRHPKWKPPELLLALENRDPGLIAAALEVGRRKGWVLKRIADTRVQKGVEKAGWGWGRAEWEGVEVWKGRLGEISGMA